MEAASLGAAILAGKATGVFQDLSQAVDQMVKVRKRTQPNRENRQVYQEGYEMYQKLFRELEGCFEKTI